MIKKVVLFCFAILPLVAHSQDKKTMKRLEAQVKLAKEQEAASHEHQNSTEKNLKLTKPGAKFLPFHMVDDANQMFTDEDLPEGKPILLVLFNPMCDHCQRVAKAILANRAKFSNVTIVFTCGMNLLGELKNFKEQSGIVNVPNFKVCGSSEEYTGQLFMSKGIPQMMTYNKDRIFKMFLTRQLILIRL